MVLFLVSMGKQEYSGRTQVSLICPCAVVREIVTRSLVTCTELALQLTVSIFLSVEVLQHVEMASAGNPPEF